MLHETDGLPVLPSLKVPKAVICTVLLVVPVSMLGVTGPTEIDDSVGFTKKPLQLTASANVASAANAPARRSLCFIDGIVISDSLGRPLLKIVAEEEFPPNPLVHFLTARNQRG